MKRALVNITFAFLISFSTEMNAQLILSEASSRNATLYLEDNRDYADFIEILNTSNAPIDLNGWYLSDDITVPMKWPFFSQIIGANQRTIVFADEVNSYGWWNSFQHTNFKINNNGESIYLVNSSGFIVDSLVVSKMEINQSVGKVNGSTSGQVYFNTTTPNALNAATSYSAIAGTPTINLPGGFYSSTIAVTASCPTGQDAVYTINSQTPTNASPIFPTVLNIGNTTVLKVRCKATGMMIGNMKTETYLYNENTSLPVVSISTDSINLYDYNTGIWVDGPNASQWHGANYYQGWRRAAKMEYFENGIKQFGKDIAINNEGGSSIGYEKHSIRMNFAHSTLGNDKLSYIVFPDAKPQISSFKNLRLRNGGNVYGISYLNGGGGVLYHDAIVESLTKGLHVNHAAYRPTVVYVNGNFWGLYELREKIDDYFYKTNANADENGIRDFNGGWDVDQYLQWDTVINDLYNATNKNTDAYYNSVGLDFDFKNVIDYYSSQIHFFNTDWITTNYTSNVKMWLDTSSTSDKRYRYTLHDMDYSFCNAYANDNMMDVVLNTGALTAHVKLIRSLLQNNKFKKEFINRYADLVNYYFHVDSVHNKYDAADALVQNEISRECLRWPTNTATQWAYKFGLLRNCADSRNIASRNEIDSLLLNKSGQVNLTIDVFPVGAGTIKLSTIQPTTLPWTGIYFKGNEVPMEAVANAGYVFDHWQTSPTGILAVDTNIFMDTFYNQHTNVTAVFKTSIGVGTQNINKDNFIQISPNPVTDNVQIYFSNNFRNKAIEIKLIDLFGKILIAEKLQLNGESFYKLNLNKLAPGQYIINVTNENGEVAKSKLAKL
jgi:hypothetical protein